MILAIKPDRSYRWGTVALPDAGFSYTCCRGEFGWRRTYVWPAGSIQSTVLAACTAHPETRTDDASEFDREQFRLQSCGLNRQPVLGKTKSRTRQAECLEQRRMRVSGLQTPHLRRSSLEPVHRSTDCLSPRPYI